MVLSTTNGIFASLAIADIFVISNTSKLGFANVSAKNSLVFFLMLFFISCILFGFTKVVLMPNLFIVIPKRFLVPP